MISRWIEVRPFAGCHLERAAPNNIGVRTIGHSARMFVSRATQMRTKWDSPFSHSGQHAALPRLPAVGNSSGATSLKVATGSPPDPTKWNYDLGGGGWGNGELESYTSSTQNAYQDGNGNLVITAIRSSTGAYTSARLQTGAPGASTKTTDLSWQYGLIVARIRLPFGQDSAGVLDAAKNIGSVGWPVCGETDIMENFGTFHNNSTSTTVTCTDRLPPAAPPPMRMSTAPPCCSTRAGQYRLPCLCHPVVRIPSHSISMAGRITPPRPRPSPPADGSSTIRSSSS